MIAEQWDVIGLGQGYFKKRLLECPVKLPLYTDAVYGRACNVYNVYHVTDELDEESKKPN